MDIDQTISINQLSEPAIEYEQCTYCNRNFFKGKLKYHQKHCNEDRPMIHSPKKTPKKDHKKLIMDLNKQIFSSQEKKCRFCNMKLPLFLYAKHQQKCKLNIKSESKVKQNEDQDVRKSSTQIDFKNKQQNWLPKIKNRGSPSPRKTKMIAVRQTYQVKLRQQLRCFRKAEEIKQIQCPACNRIFSREASLRHIPICQTLKLKQKLSIALKKREKISSHLFKINNEKQQKRFCRSVLEQNKQKLQLNELESIHSINPQSLGPHHEQSVQ